VVAWQHEIQTRQEFPLKGQEILSVVCQRAFVRVGRGFMLDCSQFVSNYDVVA
jgi:hypothetical protein